MTSAARLSALAVDDSTVDALAPARPALRSVGPEALRTLSISGMRRALRSGCMAATAIALSACVSLAGLSGGADLDASHSPEATLDAGVDAPRHAEASVHDASTDRSTPDATRDVVTHAETSTCTMCGGTTCVDTLTSATNCGACGVACKACTSGYCLAYMDTGSMYGPGPDGGATPSQGIAALSYLSPLIYWAGFATSPDHPQDNVLIGNSPSSTTLPDSYEEEVFLPVAAVPLGLANDGQTVFIGGTGFLAKFTPPSPLVVSPDSGHAELSSGIVVLDAGTVMTANLVATDAVNVYWTDSTANAVTQLAKAGGAPLTLAPDQFSPTGLTVDAKNVYWIASHTIWSLPIGTADGDPTTVASATSATTDGTLATPIVQQGGFLYWGDPGGGAVLSVPSGGGTAGTFASEQPNITELASDGTSLYWTTSTTGGASVVMQPLAGTTPITIATFPEGGAKVNGGLALQTIGGKTVVFVAVQLPEAPSISVLVKLTPPPG